MIEKIKTFFRRSVTVLWARVMTVVGAVLAVLVDPDSNSAVSNLIAVVVENPRNVALALAVIGVVTELARSRTLRR